MKIVYCILGTFNAGGMERVLTNKANYLADLGHDIYIITTDQQGRKPYFDMHPAIQHIDLGINYRADSGMLKKLLNYPVKQRIHRRRLEEQLDTVGADICISMFDNDASFVYKLNDHSKKILEIHFSRFKRVQYGRKGLWKWIDQYRSRKDLFHASRYDKFVVLTHEDKGYWGDLANIQVIPNANSFEPQQQASLEQKRVIAVGRYDYQKGFEELIAIWNDIHRLHPDWKLAIFGDGPLKQNLQEQIDRLGLTAVVQLCAPVKDIEKEYLNSAILVMTSRYEGLPMALLEGQACGLPMVSYACKCGPRDIIHNGENGYLLKEGDRQGMVQQISQLIQCEEERKRMGISSLKYARSFSQQAVMAQWLTLFNRITKS